MSGRLAGLWTRLTGIDWKAVGRRAGRLGYWGLRVTLGTVVVLYALSFLGPPPVERAEVDYDAPSEAARAAVHNLQTTTYRVTIDANRTDGDGELTQLGEWTRTVDNPGHRYASGYRPPGSGEDDATVRTRRYGTYTTGFARARNVTDGEDGGQAWQQRAEARYHPSRNAFGDPGALEGSETSVVVDAADAYAVRIEDRDAAADLVDLPDHTQQRDAAWNATVTVHVSRTEDRLTRAEYTYTVPESGETVRATYRFEYGLAVDVDRPLGTYPPGSEALTRLDLGVRTVDGLAGEVVP